jgi:hypothetical protein
MDIVNVANGIGKILGLCCLALVVGFSKVLSDQASVAGILPTFYSWRLAACGLRVGNRCLSRQAMDPDEREREPVGSNRRVIGSRGEAPQCTTSRTDNRNP